MSAQPKPNEPSMEEILASIRRIIADDDKPAAPEPAPEPEPEPAPPPAEPPAAEIDEDVLDLAAEARLIQPPEPEAPDVDFADPPAPVEPEPEPQPAPEPEPSAQAFVPPFEPSPAPQLDMAALLSDQAGAAVHNAFGALAHTVLTNNARTLEDLVREMLRPMLKAWLDDNLPTMVERLVRAEIERVARGGRR